MGSSRTGAGAGAGRGAGPGTQKLSIMGVSSWMRWCPVCRAGLVLWWLQGKHKHGGRCCAAAGQLLVCGQGEVRFCRSCHSVMAGHQQRSCTLACCPYLDVCLTCGLRTIPRLPLLPTVHHGPRQIWWAQLPVSCRWATCPCCASQVLLSVRQLLTVSVRTSRSPAALPVI